MKSEQISQSSKAEQVENEIDNVELRLRYRGGPIL